MNLQELFRREVAKKPIYVPGKSVDEMKREYNIDKIVKVGSNENPLGPSPMAVRAVQEAAATMNLYPDDYGYRLKEKLAQKHDLDVKNIVLGNGGTEILKMFAECFINEGDEAIVPSTTYNKYATEVGFLGGVPVVVPTKENFAIDVEGMVKAVTDKTKLLFICNPNNPTGNIVPKEQIKWLIENTPEHVTIILDEAYYDYAIFSDEYEDTRPYLDQRETLVILRTFSKSAGLAGVRIGYALANEEIATALNRTKLTFGVNCFALAAGIAALDDTEHIETAKTLNRRSIEMMEAYFEKRGLPYVKSYANFIFVDVQRDVREVYNELLKLGVVTRGGHLWKLDHWLRISTTTEENTQIILDALEKVLFGEG